MSLEVGNSGTLAAYETSNFILRHRRPSTEESLLNSLGNSGVFAGLQFIFRAKY